MGWEKRERGGRYYTRSRKVGDRVAREYVGGGLIGELAARFDEIERERRGVESAKAQLERAQLEAIVGQSSNWTRSRRSCAAPSSWRTGTGITKGNGGGCVSQEPELRDETKAKLGELRALSERAEAGERGARRELRRAVRDSAPEVIARASDIARKGHKMLISTASAGDPLMEEALVARLDVMRAEIAGEYPTPLEMLLTERVVSCWLLV